MFSLREKLEQALKLPCGAVDEALVQFHLENCYRYISMTDRFFSVKRYIKEFAL